MVMKIRGWTKKEIEALERKSENPTVDVKCPNCGENLTFTKIGNSAKIECPTKGCMKPGTIRGL